ncbi:hypothetical protein [Pseudomonas chlororaphis]|uniref:hypothetical protein n=1 Tax=Pseudomonas chlororaphis TaxID=587753 RepID=UPI001186AA8F|nr:hypothetical protein [Pseudomonas chlororaphis]
MNTQELLAVAELINACEVFNHFTHGAVEAAKEGVPLQLSKARERKLHVATVSMRVALHRLQPHLLDAMERVERQVVVKPSDPLALSA